MRARTNRRLPRAAQLLWGALLLALPATALAATNAVSASHPTQPVATLAARHHSHLTRTHLIVRRHPRHLLVGQKASLPGHLVHARPHVRVTLQFRSRHHWETLAHTRVGRHGRFKLHYSIRSNRTMWLRVRFAGNRKLHASVASAGRAIGLAPTVASWYYDGGGTACGFHASYGVANKTLPCGTKVTFVYHGRTVTATVDDRGPYVAGRSYDFNQNTARALGMYGVATVQASL